MNARTAIVSTTDCTGACKSRTGTNGAVAIRATKPYVRSGTSGLRASGIGRRCAALAAAIAAALGGASSGAIRGFQTDPGAAPPLPERGTPPTAAPDASPATMPPARAPAVIPAAAPAVPEAPATPPVALAATRLPIAVPPVTVLDAIGDKARANGQAAELGQIAEGLDAKLADALLNTRKFDVRAHADLRKLVANEEGVPPDPPTSTDPADAGGVSGPEAAGFRAAGIPYYALVQIDDFQDQVQTAEFGAIGQKASRRQLRLSATCRIYDVARNALLESARVSLTEFDVRNFPSNVVSEQGGDMTEEVIGTIADRMADRIALRIADILFPARALVVRDGTVVFNRGEGSGIAFGEIWEVFAEGDEIVDPDTGEVLGADERPVGFVRVTSVAPKYSRGEICGVDRGIARGCVLRKSTRSSCEGAGR